eukprot:CAMPEP_0194777956 /NCGR_PEP_ID=MMETSP0323_2-20130528/67023_1 /TAXON_ID=2866 ORGANISM="Crypthecodinium cohnii, Strain Seligo" /NCGR_SAMPLE_ID=MMETSP0323_2 /ASSEMBLY_ACC=CAM_ASM_000346 /LENGTH=47 /DNA_ID= /DNA_START= /DNA_END= /DNA_ORIENTATION=
MRKILSAPGSEDAKFLMASGTGDGFNFPGSPAATTIVVVPVATMVVS